MYEVIEFKLLPGLNLKLVNQKKLEFFDQEESPRSGLTRTISIQVPDSGDQDISLMRYVVGERITFRKSLTGLKLIRGLPDFSGAISRNDITGQLSQIVQDRKDRFIRNKHSMHEKIRMNNLCMEIPLPTEWSPEVDWTNQITARGAVIHHDFAYLEEHLTGRAANPTPEAQTIGELMAAEMRQRMDRNGFTRQMMEGTGTVTGRMTMTRPTGPTANQHQMETFRALIESSRIGTRDMYYSRGGNVGRSVPASEISRRYAANWDYDGDAVFQSMSFATRHTQQEENRRFLQEMHQSQANAVPTRYVDNSFDYLNDRAEVVPVDLASAVTAVRELTEGERARPPQSRGPRPRNQRW